MPSKPRPPLRGAFAGRLPGFRFATAFFAVRQRAVPHASPVAEDDLA